MAETRDRRDFTLLEASELLTYCQNTGEFRWKIERNSHGGKIYPGTVAGSDKDGYRQIIVFGRPYRAHHLAWLFMTGDWPPIGVDIDHINRNRADNRWSNLRQASRGQNNMNSAPRSDNKSGCKGVSLVKVTGKWDARIIKNGKVHLLGTFAELDDAIAARRSAEAKMYGEYSAHT